VYINNITIGLSKCVQSNITREKYEALSVTKHLKTLIRA
jgi:hypothetical protein